MEEYADILESLPLEIQHNLTMLKELDLHASKVMKLIEKSAQELNPEPLNDAYEECLRYAEEKVQLATQTYEIVDRHIRRLDEDHSRYEYEMMAGIGAIETPKKRRRTDSPQPQRIKREESLRTSVEDMPVYQNEPTYCYCGQVSFGEMIACDNDDCQIEWFHCSCVGLKAPPRGKWYCNECKAKGYK